MARQTRRSFLKYSGALLGGIAAGSTVTAATSNDRFLVETRSRTPSSVEVVHDLSAVDLAVVRGDESALRRSRAVKDYAPDAVYELDLPVEDVVTASEDASDEPFYPLQWDKQAQSIPQAHEVTRGEGSRVAVIDTGVDPNHPDLAPALNTQLSANFTEDGGSVADVGYHGTHVSGIVAADDRNDFGVVGSAPGTDLVGLRVFSGDGGATFGDILAALVYSAAVGCDAANLSLGAYPIPRQGLGQFYGKVLNRITTYANRQGTLIVASAGNAGADLQHDKSFISLPNEAANVLTVSATGPIGFGWGEPGLEAPPWEPAFYTNYGTNEINVSAPGGNADLDAPAEEPSHWDWVLSTIPSWFGFHYAYLLGTSMAAPQVTGAAALVASENPSANANQVRSILERSADDVGDRAYHGAGFLNPADAVR